MPILVPNSPIPASLHVNKSATCNYMYTSVDVSIAQYPQGGKGRGKEGMEWELKARGERRGRVKEGEGGRKGWTLGHAYIKG